MVGLAGDADMRVVLTRADGGDAVAALAVDVYLHRLRAGIAAMAAALGGIDALVFTGGVGEHAPAIRRRAATGLGFLGVAIDAGANNQLDGDAEITAAGRARQDAGSAGTRRSEMARQTRSGAVWLTARATTSRGHAL